MNKIKLGSFALCVIICGYLGSVIGIAISLCFIVIVEGIIDGVVKANQTKRNSKEKEVK